MAQTLTYVAVVAAGLAIVASQLINSRKRLLPSLAAAVALAAVGALLIAAGRAFG